jgi:hypothetical protein
MRRYQSAQAWAKEVPGVRIWILCNAQGKAYNWHVSEPAPEGLWCLLGVLE